MQKRIYLLLGVLGISIFIFQIFVFESPDGIIGYFLCLFSTLLTIVSFIKLFQISTDFREFLSAILDVLFFWS